MHYLWLGMRGDSIQDGLVCCRCNSSPDSMNLNPGLTCSSHVPSWSWDVLCSVDSITVPWPQELALHLHCQAGNSWHWAKIAIVSRIWPGSLHDEKQAQSPDSIMHLVSCCFYLPDLEQNKQLWLMSLFFRFLFIFTGIWLARLVRSKLILRNSMQICHMAVLTFQVQGVKYTLTCLPYKMPVV